MFMISTEELNNRLGWSLNQKIDHSLFIIENALAYSNNAYVSYSGGKDSTILLHLCRFIKKQMKAVFFNTTNEFPEIYSFIKNTDNVHWIRSDFSLKQVIEKEGFPLISKEQSQYIREARHTKSKKLFDLRINGRIAGQGRISKKWQYLINAPFEISDRCCYWLKKRPAYQFEKQTGMLPFIGTSINESRLRFQRYLKSGCNSFESKRKASYPLSIWTEKDKWDYIKLTNIPICEIYYKGETQTGCMICGYGCHKDNRFNRLNELHPRAFEIGMNFKNNGITYSKAIQTILNKSLCTT
jgi:3'-phosphoadenosine 5'-phosphosulfate sulfotransferase (PAPS reductase)/FAD synthetase